MGDIWIVVLLFHKTTYHLVELHRLEAGLNYSGGDIMSFYFAKNFEGAQPSIPTLPHLRKDENFSQGEKKGG